jgi:hypothetical protein
MKALLMLVALSTLVVSAFGQGCTTTDSSSALNAAGAVHSILAPPEGVLESEGIVEKILPRAGDSAAVAIIKAVSEEDYAKPWKVTRMLLILTKAFTYPDMVQICADREPKATMLLLAHLQNLAPLRLQAEINKTRVFVAQHVTPQYPVPLPATGHVDEVNWQATTWIDSVMQSIGTIKPGMTRKDLLKVFTTEGGLSSPQHQRFVLQECPYIKVDVDFAPALKESDHFIEAPEDKIVKISRPFLEYSIMD